MIKEDDFVIFIDLKGNEWLRQVSAKEHLDTHQGRLEFVDVIGKEYGSIIRFTKGSGKVLVLEPHLNKILLSMPHATNIIYEDNAAIMAFRTNVRLGDRILEIGSGSGGLTLYLATLLFQTKSKLQTEDISTRPIVSIDNKSDHQAIAKKNLIKFDLEHLVDFRCGDMATDLLLKPNEQFDAAVIDIPQPWTVLSIIRSHIKNGKQVLIFVPNWAQIELTVAEAEKDHAYYVLDVFELFRRPIVVDAIKHITRPMTRAVVYSGIIINLIKRPEEQKDDIVEISEFEDSEN